MGFFHYTCHYAQIYISFEQVLSPTNLAVLRNSTYNQEEMRNPMDLL